jgi:prepilin-type processing-associated H-X9-DG protein
MRYQIQGSDQKEYGPITAEQLRQWFQEGRIHAGTLAKPEGAAEWQRLDRLSAWADAPPPLPAAPGPRPAESRPGTGWMIWAILIAGLSLVMVLAAAGLTFFAAASRGAGIPWVSASAALVALGGMVLGIVAAVRLSRGRRRGTSVKPGLVLAGGSTLLLVLAAMGFGAALLLELQRGLERARATSRRIICLNNMRQLTLATVMYVDDNKGKFPPPDQWCEALNPYYRDMRLLRCPDHPGSLCSYVLNRKLAGKADKDIQQPWDTVLFFESDLGWDKTGGLEDAKTRHQGMVIVGFADGSARAVKVENLDNLRWEP